MNSMKSNSRKESAFITFSPGMREGVRNHSIVTFLINTNGLTAWTIDLMLPDFSLEPLDDSCLVTANHMTVTYFIVAPEFGFAGCALDC